MLPTLSPTHLGNNFQAPPQTNDGALHDEPSSPRRHTQHDHTSNTRSRPKLPSNIRSASASEAASPTSSSSNYKIMKDVARKGYLEDRYRVYGAYPTDEELRGGSVPCESESDVPTLEMTPKAHQNTLSNSAPPSAKSREKKSLTLTVSFARLKAEYESKKAQGEAILQDDARFKRAEIEERSRLDKLDKETTPLESPGKTTASAQGRHGIFGNTRASLQKPSRETENGQKSRLMEAESRAWESPTHRAAETRGRIPLRETIAELREVHRLPRLPDAYKMSRWWDGCDVDPSPELMAEHWKYMEQLANEGKVDFQTKVGQLRQLSTEENLSPSSLPATTSKDPNARPSPNRRPRSSRDVSHAKQAYIDSETGEVVISQDFLEKKLRELAGELGITAEITVPTVRARAKRAAQPRGKINSAQKRANEGPPEHDTETFAKKVRLDSGISVRDNDESDGSSDIDSSGNEEVDKTRESRESSAAWVRRSKRRIGDGTPLYRADRHPGDQFLKTSSPKARAESPVSSSENEIKDDEVVVRWPTKSPPPYPPTPFKLMLAKYPSSSTTPKKCGRQPGSRVVNGKVVRPSEDTTPVSPKSPAEHSSKVTSTTTPTFKHPKVYLPATSKTLKRTPIPSEKVRTIAINSKTTSDTGIKKTPAQTIPRKTANSPTAAKTSAARSEPKKIDVESFKLKSSNSTTVSKSTAARSASKNTTTSSSNSQKSNNSIAAPAPMRVFSGFLRGDTDNELESLSKVSIHSGHGDKKKFSFRLPP